HITTHTHNPPHTHTHTHTYTHTHTNTHTCRNYHKTEDIWYGTHPIHHKFLTSKLTLYFFKPSHHHSIVSDSHVISIVLSNIMNLISFVVSSLFDVSLSVCLST